MGAGGIWEVPFKNCMTPLSLPIFSRMPPLAVIFLDDPSTKKFNRPSRFYLFLIFSIIPLLHVVVLTMKTKFTIP